MYKCLTIQLTESCNMKCSFCFAQIKGHKILKPEDFRLILEFANDSLIEQLEFTGGEPFLHPHFVEFIDEAMKFKSIFIFSNLTVPNCIEKLLSDGLIESEKIAISVNTLNDNVYTEQQRVAFDKNLRDAVTAGMRIILGRTFYKKPFVLDDLVEMSVRYGLPMIRISVSNPSMNVLDNEWMSRQDFSDFCSFLREYIEEDKNKGILFRWGCPIIPCFANEIDIDFFEKKQMLSRICRVHVGVTADLYVGHCYIMQDNCRKLYDFLNYDEVKKYIEDEFISFRKKYMPTDICKTCKWKVDNLACGCVGQWKEYRKKECV